ncbi:delta-like protein C isoform X1 [Haliotis asinina]|uniref:delta-like protein C isoform X1 n=1 Tax=Haliotis asinina TaxID=109174 RepID=UPI0035321044
MKDQVLNMWGLITIVVIFSSQCLAAEKASCDKNPCQNNGVCKVSNNTVVCTCTKGYSGDRCQNADKAACDKNPCTNNGACKVSNNKVVCTCKKGYSGNRCCYENVGAHSSLHVCCCHRSDEPQLKTVGYGHNITRCKKSATLISF